jgi:hypothetical protein
LPRTKAHGKQGDDSSYMTGQVLHPNGGEMVHGWHIAETGIYVRTALERRPHMILGVRPDKEAVFSVSFFPVAHLRPPLQARYVVKSGWPGRRISNFPDKVLPFSAWLNRYCGPG